MSFSIVAAVHRYTGGIGMSGSLPWELPVFYREHLFQMLSKVPSARMRNVAIMGRNTLFQFLRKDFLPFGHGTLHIVLSEDLSQHPEKYRHPKCILVSSLEEHEQQFAKICSDYYEGETNQASSPSSIIVIAVASFQEALSLASRAENTHQTFVLGGERLFSEAFSTPGCTDLLLTEVLSVRETTDRENHFLTPEFDAFFPVSDLFTQRMQAMERLGLSVHSEQPFWNVENQAWRYKHHFFHVGDDGGKGEMLQEAERERLWRMIHSLRAVASRKNNYEHEEKRYLALVGEVMREGKMRGDRTATGTVSIFGRRLEFSLTHHFPLLTTKKVDFRQIAEELLWFISGNTSSETLRAKKVNIWNANGSREFLDKRGLHNREVGDLGPVYGFQWRHFGAAYSDVHADYTGQGKDQLAECIRLIREDPLDRRIVMSAWNPAQLHEMALPPCHVLVQFYVDVDTQQLNCQMYQRSADLGLGVPYNIACYSLLTYMIAHICNLLPGKLVLVFGDTHVYLNHRDQLYSQLEREPYEFPTLRIANREDLREIDDFKMEDFVLENYRHHPFLSMKMAV